MELVLSGKDVKKKSEDVHVYSLRLSDFRFRVIVAGLIVWVSGGTVFMNTPSGGRIPVNKF